MLYCVTNRCNFACSHCLGSFGRQGTDMKVSDFEFAINRLSFDPIILITGGEPFVHKDIESIIEKAVATGKLVTVISNGSLLGQHKEFLKEKLRSGKFFVQVTWDKRYYTGEPDWKAVKELGLEVDRELIVLDSLGRAKENGLKSYGRRYPMCVNSLLVSIQKGYDIKEVVKCLTGAGKFCTFTVEPDLKLTLSECHRVELCDLKDENWERIAGQKIKNGISCKECGLNSEVAYKMLGR